MAAPVLPSLLGPLGTDGPLYLALARRVRTLTADGRLPIGTRLPPERELASALHVSRATVSAAYGLLRERGWLEARQGSGTWTRLPAGPPLAAWLPAPPSPHLIDLAHAAPSAPPQVAGAYAAALDEIPALLPTHGYHPLGLPELRAAIADRFTARGLPTTSEQVLVTSGALHALALAVEVVTRRGERVLVESPTYPNALDAIAHLGRRAVGVAVAAGESGRAVWDLTRAARDSTPQAAYLMPDFQNPTGLTLDEDSRTRLAVGLEQHGVIMIVDETLAELGLDHDAGTPLAALAPDKAAITVGSMSKSCWGGLRVGWLRADPPTVARAAALAGRSYLASPVLEQLAAVHLLGDPEVLAVRRAALRESRDALVAALADALPSWQVSIPTGGLALWCGLPWPSSGRLAAAAREHGVLLAPGTRFGTGHAFDDRLRLPFTAPPDDLERGVQVLAAVWAELPRAGRTAVDAGLIF